MQDAAMNTNAASKHVKEVLEKVKDNNDSLVVSEGGKDISDEERVTAYEEDEVHIVNDSE